MGEKKESPWKTLGVGWGSRWQAHWSAGSAGTEVPVVLALGQDSSDCPAALRVRGWHGDPRYPGRGHRTEEVKAEA